MSVHIPDLDAQRPSGSILIPASVNVKTDLSVQEPSGTIVVPANASVVIHFLHASLHKRSITITVTVPAPIPCSAQGPKYLTFIPALVSVRERSLNALPPRFLTLLAVSVSVNTHRLTAQEDRCLTSPDVCASVPKTPTVLVIKSLTLSRVSVGVQEPALLTVPEDKCSTLSPANAAKSATVTVLPPHQVVSSPRPIVPACSALTRIRVRVSVWFTISLSRHTDSAKVYHTRSI